MRLHPEATVETYRSRGWWSGQTWDDVFRSHVTTRGGRLAVVDPPNRADLFDGTPGRWTWGQLDHEVDRLAASLRVAGIGREDVVGIQLPNSKELVATYLAVSRVGAIATPFPMQYRRHELEQLGAVASLRALVTTPRFGDRDHGAIVESLRSSLPGLQRVLGFGDDLPEGWHPAGVEPAGAPRHSPAAAVDAADCVTICWTSGTEAVPKGVPRCHDDWIALAWGAVDAARLDGDDVILNPFPMVNMAGLGGVFLAWLLSGSTLVQHHPFDLHRFLGQLVDEGVTYTVAAPALLTQLVEDEELLERTDLSRLRMVGSGSSTLPPATARAWQERFGVDLINLYGSNEGSVLINDPVSVPDAAERTRCFPRFGVPGRHRSPVRTANWVTSRLVAADGTEITEAGRPGELRMRGPTVFAGYLGDDPGPGPFDAEGFLCTGDVFEIGGDDDEYYVYVDRAKDVIIRGGMNISPAEIEHLVAGHPAIEEVAAIGVPDAVLGERICAVVVPRAGAAVDLGDLVAHLADRGVASYKHPEQLTVVDALPRNPLGKVRRAELRRRLAG